MRPNNEDALVDRSDAGLWAVADGMGGLSRGELASGLVKEALDRLTPPGGLRAYIAAVRVRLEEVHARLLGECGAGGCGSTVAVLLMAEGRHACTWAGDCRVYRRRDGRLERLTHDHSLVEELVMAGVITSDEARTHPLANRVTRTVGINRWLELAEVEGQPAPGDRFLLSSDGLHGALPHDVLAGLVATPDLEAAADGLIAAALRAGAPDNVSFVLVDVAGGPALRAPG